MLLVLGTVTHLDVDLFHGGRRIELLEVGCQVLGGRGVREAMELSESKGARWDGIKSDAASAGLAGCREAAMWLGKWRLRLHRPPSGQRNTVELLYLLSDSTV
jgi:hypothetical protein